MRKLIAILLAALMVLALCACDASHRSIDDDAAAYLGTAAAAPADETPEASGEAAPAASAEADPAASASGEAS